MAKAEPKSLFRRLTNLFRSGPVIRKKIRGIDTTMAGPDKVKSNATLLFQKSMSPTYASITGNAYNLSERLMRYQDFQEMQYTPEIASALDIYADETVAADDKGRSLHIYSDNERIRELLEDLFINNLNIEFNLRGWTRNLCKYGDLFLFLDVSPSQGVINAFPVPVNEVEREENYDKEDPFAVRFRWVTLGNRTLENWEIGHFRLISDDLFLPYGASIIEPARRIWRQLILLEDAMLVYRVVRAPERRVFYIDVANVPPEQVEGYVEEQRKNMRTSPVVDRQTGRVDLRFNPLSVDEDYFIPVRGGDTGTKIDTLQGLQNQGNVEDVSYLQKKLFSALKIPRAYLGFDEMLSSKATLCLEGTTMLPLLDGRTLSISELTSEHEAGQQHWVYSTDPETGTIKPGKVTKAWKTKDVTELHEVTLDDGSVIRCTENHPFMLRDGTYMRADMLQPGQSLMPLYRRTSSYDDADDLDGYDMVLQDGEWKYTHRFVYHEKVRGEYTILKSRVVHHMDFNKRNNSPENLAEMTWDGHRELHNNNLEHTLFRPDVIAKREPVRIAALKGEKHRAKKSVQMTAQHADPNSKLSQWVHGDEIGPTMSGVMADNWRKPEYREKKIEQIHEAAESFDVRKKRSDGHAFTKAHREYDIVWLIRFCKDNGVYSINQFRSDYKDSVASISPVGIRYVNKLIKVSGFDNWTDFARRALGQAAPAAKVQATKAFNGFGLTELKAFCLKHDVKTVHQFVPKHYKSVSHVSPITAEQVSRIVANNGYASMLDFFMELYRNHKVASVRVIKLDAPTAVYDITVEGWHNFAVQGHGAQGEFGGCVIVHNSQEDIRFSRTIAVIQKTIISELSKIAMIHLYAHGFEGDDLQNFTLRLSNPSTVAQQQKLELWRSKLEIAGSAPENLLDREFLRKEVMGLTQEQIDTIEDGIKRDKKFDAEVEAITGEAMGDEGGEGGDDLFGGGGDEAGGEEAPAPAEKGGGEKPPEENAGEEPEEEIEPEMELLTSHDEPDDMASRVLEKDGPPLKANPELAKNRRRSRRKKRHGPNALASPDLGKMVSHDNDSFTDPYDGEWMSSVVSDPLGEVNVTKPRKRSLPSDISRMLGNMGKRFGLAKPTNDPRSRIIVERGEDVQDAVNATRLDEGLVIADPASHDDEIDLDHLVGHLVTDDDTDEGDE